MPTGALESRCSVSRRPWMVYWLSVRSVQPVEDWPHQLLPVSTSSQNADATTPVVHWLGSAAFWQLAHPKDRSASLQPTAHACVCGVRVVTRLRQSCVVCRPSLLLV